MNQHKWLQFILLYLTRVLIALTQMKVAPVIEPLAKHLHVSLTQTSWLTSIFTLSGVFLAIPGAAIISKLGARRLLLIIIALIVLGNFLGTIGHNFYWLLFTRVLEGISFATIIMIAIVLISGWFGNQSKGALVIGIFTTSPAVGTLIAMNLYKPLTRHFGDYASWYLCGGLALILLLLCYFFIREEADPDEDNNQPSSKTLSTFMEAIKNHPVWLLAILMGCIAFELYTFIAIYPLLYIDFYHLSSSTANFYSSLFGLFGMPFGIAAGYLLDKTQRPKMILLLAYVVLVIATGSTLMLQGLPVLFILQLVVLASVCSLISASIMILVPRIVKRRAYISYSIGLVNLFYYSCIVIGAPLITRLVEAKSWKLGVTVLVAVAILGGIVTLLLPKLQQLKKPTK